MIAVDVESSGTEAHKHSILSVGAIDLGNPSRPFFYEECRIWDGAKMEAEAFAVNGSSVEAATGPEQAVRGRPGAQIQDLGA